MPNRRPDYRMNRPHKDFLTTLELRFKSPKEFEDKVRAAISNVFDVEEVAFEEVIKIKDDLLKLNPMEHYARTQYVDY